VQKFQTNANGVLWIVEAVAPIHEKSKSMPRIINITSGGGSIAGRLDLTAKQRALACRELRIVQARQQ
jgi:NADP-dependent 3-hydroxy acid dehydrogenase YdfG